MPRSPVALGVLQVAQHAVDLDVSTAFYCDVLGGELLGKFDPPGLAIVRFGDLRLLLEAAAPQSLLYFAVGDIDDAYGRLTKRGVEFEDSPHLVHRDDNGVFGSAGGEEWMTFLRDPAGALVGLVQRRDPG